MQYISLFGLEGIFVVLRGVNRNVRNEIYNLLGFAILSVFYPAK